MSFLNLLGESARFLMSTMVPHLQICPCQIQICQYKRVEIGQHSMAWLRAWPYVCVCISTSLCVCKTPYIYASQWHGYRRRHIHIYTCMYLYKEMLHILPLYVMAYEIWIVVTCAHAFIVSIYNVIPTANKREFLGISSWGVLDTSINEMSWPTSPPWLSWWSED